MRWLLFLFFLSACFAHVPLKSCSNHNVVNACEIINPLKSWVIYGDNQGIEYYSLNLSAGDRLRLIVLTTTISNNPRMALLIPGGDNGFGFDLLEVPDNYSSVLFDSINVSLKEYEPFTPSSYYKKINVDLIVNKTGRYYLAVVGDGKFSLAVGYKEEFTLYEFIRVPIDVINIHIWEGQNALLVLLPFMIIVLGGVIINCRLNKLRIKNWGQALGFIGALTYFGGSAITLTQMLLAIIGAEFNWSFLITIIFALIPLIIGYSLISNLVKTSFIKRFLYGLIGLFTWSGLIIGPLIVMLSAFFIKKPKRRR